MHRWSLSHGRDGFSIRLQEVPSWVPLYEWALDKFLAVTGHFFCCNIPSWAWNVNLRQNENSSLGDYLWRAGQTMHNVSFHASTQIKMIPVDRETGIYLWPNSDEDSWLWNETEENI